MDALADINGPFFATDLPFRNWSSFPYYQLDLDHAPFVDRERLERGFVRACAYLETLHAQGYRGVVIDNLPHLVTFDDAPIPIYPHHSPYRRRALIYKAMLARLCDAANELGMAVYLTVDMQWSTPPVRRFVGWMDAENPRIATVNRWALDEIFSTLPHIRGIVVRVGETGGAHDHGGYAGHLIYTSPKQLRDLIGSLLPVCERYERQLVVRTWSVGIGDLGDLIWSPERYREVFAGLHSPHLVASIKHVPADFFRLLPHNPTIGLPGPKQWVEMQNRREYELFGMVPSSIATLHQRAIRHAAATDQVAAVWAWNSTGGWGGGRAAIGQGGWSVWTQLNSMLTAALAHDPACDTRALLDHACCERFGTAFGSALAELFLASERIMEQAWYAGECHTSDLTLGSITIPPLLWVWWMRPTASLPVWAYLADTRDGEQICADSAAAQRELQPLVQRLAAMLPAHNAEAVRIVQQVVYWQSVLEVAQAIRELLLPALTAAWHNQLGVWNSLHTQATHALTILRAHRSAWESDDELTPLELDEIEGMIEEYLTAPHLLWLKARGACAIVERLQNPRPRQRITTRRIGFAAAGLLAAALLTKRPQSAGLAGIIASLLLIPPLRQRAITLLTPWISKRLNLLPTVFFEAGPSLGEWAKQ